MSQTQANLVEVRGIRFSRGDRVIFDDISLSVPRGKITAIMGPSGIGKTTLLRLIGGQIPPDRGEILFDGENVPQMTRSRLYTVRKRMSMLFSPARCSPISMSLTTLPIRCANIRICRLRCCIRR